MNVHLTAELDAYVRWKVESGLYGSASEVIREGLRLLARRDAEETLEALLIEGVESGEATAMTPTGWKVSRRGSSRPHRPDGCRLAKVCRPARGA